MIWHNKAAGEFHPIVSASQITLTHLQNPRYALPKHILWFGQCWDQVIPAAPGISIGRYPVLLKLVTRSTLLPGRVLKWPFGMSEVRACYLSLS